MVDEVRSSSEYSQDGFLLELVKLLELALLIGLGQLCDIVLLLDPENTIIHMAHKLRNRLVLLTGLQNKVALALLNFKLAQNAPQLLKKILKHIRLDPKLLLLFTSSQLKLLFEIPFIFIVVFLTRFFAIIRVSDTLWPKMEGCQDQLRCNLHVQVGPSSREKNGTIYLD